jgi:hypothetical protein
MGIMANIRYGFGHAVQWTGEKIGWQGMNDTGEFLKATADPTYMPAVYRQAASSDPAERARQMQESNRFTKDVRETIAPNVETAQVTAKQTAVVAGAAAITVASGGATAPLLLEAPGLAGAVEMVEDMRLNEGEAPVRSLMRMYSPVQSDYGTLGNMALDFAGIRGDAHYANGGLPDNHPTRLAHMQGVQTDVQGPAVATTQETLIDTKATYMQRMVSGFKDSTGGGFTFGIGSLLGIAVGVAAIAAGALPIIGASLLVGGALFGQKLFDMANPQAAVSTPSAAPVSPSINNTQPVAAASDQPAVVVPPVVGPAMPAKEQQLGV